MSERSDEIPVRAYFERKSPLSSTETPILMEKPLNIGNFSTKTANSVE